MNLSAPSVFLAMDITTTRLVETGLVEQPPTMRLAHLPGAPCDNILAGARGVPQIPQNEAPSILISYVYLNKFLKMRNHIRIRSWVLDSGAFTAHNSGKPIDLKAFTEAAKELLAKDKKLVEVFALDVIGDHRATLKNAEYMWKHGVPAIPTYHVGEPVSYLKHIAKHYPKIAFGGAVGYGKKHEWATAAMKLIWPKKVHGFGFGSEKAVLTIPFHSTDATNWQLQPCRNGSWKAFGGKLSWRGSNQNLRAEIEWYLALERKARHRWAKQMKELENE